MPFEKILVANRSEIAIRVFRAAAELGIPAVAVYSAEDRLALHRFSAGEAHQVGAGMTPTQAYLDIDEMIAATASAETGETDEEEYGYLTTEKTYRDFHLSLRFKCEADGNSGVYLHTAFEPGTATVTEGRQVEIDRTIGHHTGGIYGDGKGWIAWPAPELETVIRPDDWNDYVIRAEGPRIQIWINGYQTVDYTETDPDIDREGVIAPFEASAERVGENHLAQTGQHRLVGRTFEDPAREGDREGLRKSLQPGDLQADRGGRVATNSHE